MPGIVYFVSYAVGFADGGFGNTEITMPRQITTVDQVRSMEAEVTRQIGLKAIVLYYQPLRRA